MYRYSCRIVMFVCSIEWCAGEMLAGANAVQFIGGLLSESVMAQGGGPGADPCRGCAGSLCSCVLCHNSMRGQHSYDGTTISVSVDRHSTIIVLARECQPWYTGLFGYYRSLLPAVDVRGASLADALPSRSQVMIDQLPEMVGSNGGGTRGSSGRHRR